MEGNGGEGGWKRDGRARGRGKGGRGAVTLKATLSSETIWRLPPASDASAMAICDSTSCCRNSVPTSPVAPSTAIEICVDESARAACAARSAFEQSSASTTSEICRSDEPCAIARMLTPAVVIALVKVAPVPRRKAMPSPTMATIEWPYSVLMSATRPRCTAERRGWGGWWGEHHCEEQRSQRKGRGEMDGWWVRGVGGVSSPAARARRPSRGRRSPPAPLPPRR